MLNNFEAQLEQNHAFNTKMMICDGIFWGAGFAFLHPNIVIPGFIQNFTADPLWPNLILAFSLICLGLPQVFSVFIIQRLNTIKASLVVFAALQRVVLFFVALTAFYATTTELGFLKIWICFYVGFNLCCGLCFPVWISYMGRLYDPNKRGQAVGLQVFFCNLSSTFASCFVLWILSLSLPFSTKYGGAFLLGWGFICVGIIPLALAKEAKLPVDAKREKIGFFSFIKKLFNTFENKNFRWFCLAMILYSGSYMVLGLLPQHGLEQQTSLRFLFLEKKDDWIGFWAIIIVGSQVIAAPIIGKLSDQIGARKILGISYLFLAWIPCYAFFTPSLPFYSVIFFGLGVAMSCFFVGLIGSLLEFASPQETPYYICVQELIKVPFLLGFSFIGGKLYNWNPLEEALPLGRTLCFGIPIATNLLAAFILFKLVKPEHSITAKTAESI